MSKKRSANYSWDQLDEAIHEYVLSRNQGTTMISIRCHLVHFWSDITTTLVERSVQRLLNAERLVRLNNNTVICPQTGNNGHSSRTTCSPANLDVSNPKSKKRNKRDTQPPLTVASTSQQAVVTHQPQPPITVASTSQVVVTHQPQPPINIASTSQQVVVTHKPQPPLIVKDRAFISYRRSSGSHLASLVHQLLTDVIPVWMDIFNIKVGPVRQILRNAICESTHFVAILTEGCLGTCSTSDDDDACNDWQHMDISVALNQPGINIVLLLGENYELPQTVPEHIKKILECNTVVWSHFRHDESIKTLRKRFHK